MKQIANFFTLYWCIYFPTCIAFNDLPGFSSVDEVMTGVLVIFTFMRYGKSSITNVAPWKEYMFFIGLLGFYVIYSLLFGRNVVNAIWYDLIQQVRPWSIIFCTWILNPQFTKRQTNFMLVTMVVTLFAFMFYNPQMTSVVGGGEGQRIAAFGQLAICVSMAWYLFTEDCQKNKVIAAAIAVIGLMSMKFKYYGQFGAWMFLLFYMRDKFNAKSLRMYSQLVVLLAVVLYLGWERIDTYYVAGADNEELARPMINKATWQILFDYFPFGCGLGSFGTAASAVYYSPLWREYHLNNIWGLHFGGAVGFHCDSFFSSFAQIGFFGLIFFVIFWKRRFHDFSQISELRTYKVALMAFFCVFIEWFGDQSFFSGKGMGYMMLMGLCLNAPREDEEDDEDDDEDDDEEEEC